ncbi:TPA: antibiotic biosynthesis monooxygenase [Escherichia coli]
MLQTALALHFRPQLRGEETNLRFDVLQDPEVKSRFYIYEIYKDEAAVAFHKTTPHYLACVEKLESLMSCPPPRAA